MNERNLICSTCKKKEARNGSLYCSDKCILKAALGTPCSKVRRASKTDIPQCNQMIPGPNLKNQHDYGGANEIESIIFWAKCGLLPSGNQCDFNHY